MSKYGWAAFLASVISLSLFGWGTAQAAGSRPIYACFSPQNAALIGRLGADDPSVRYGFETGECLALPVGVPLNDVERHGALWRFRVFGAKPYLYAADWAAGFQPTADPIPPGFERYLPVTAALLANGRTYARCHDEFAQLEARFQDHDRRWREYQAWSRSRANSTSPKIIIYLSDTGPKLVAEGQELRRQAERLTERCGAVASVEADDDFLAFARTAQYA
jgi:hypothetical protein